MSYEDRYLIASCPVCGKTYYTKFANELKFYEDPSLDVEPKFSMDLAKAVTPYRNFSLLIECPDCSTDNNTVMEYFNISIREYDDGNVGEAFAEFTRYHHKHSPKNGDVRCIFGDTYSKNRKALIRCDDWENAYSIINGYAITSKYLEQGKIENCEWNAQSDSVDMKVERDSYGVYIEFSFSEYISNLSIATFIRTLRSCYETLETIDGRGRRFDIDASY